MHFSAKRGLAIACCTKVHRAVKSEVISLSHFAESKLAA